MELELSRKNIPVTETILSTTLEQPVESDALLPDYCPDMLRIFKCAVRPSVTQWEISGGHLIIEGMADVHIYYSSADHPLCQVEYRLPFSRAVELEGNTEGACALVQPAMGYFNCRMVGPRRLDLRGVVNLCLRVTVCRREQVLCKADGMGVQCRTRPLEVCRLLGQQCRPFTIREELELDKALPPAAAVLRAEACPIVTDHKVLPGKVLAKGELALTVFYRAENEGSTMETTRFTLPVSQIFDVEGADESCTASVSFCAGSCTVQPRPDLDGAASILTAEISLTGLVTVCRGETVTAVTDCFCTRYPCRCQEKPLALTAPLPPVEEHLSLRELLDLPPEVDRVLDLWTEVSSWSLKWEEGRLLACGKLLVGMFTLDGDARPEYYDRLVEFSLPLMNLPQGDWSDAGLRCQTAETEYSVTAGRVELRCTLEFTGVLLRCSRQTLLTDLAVEEEKPLARENSSCLTLCFAEAGEQIWDIAKRYNTSPALILEENQVEEELKEKTVLLIPVL